MRDCDDTFALSIARSQPKAPRKGVLRGSVHVHTSGYGCGAYRDGPPSSRFPTWRSETESHVPDFGHSTSWQHPESGRRACEGRTHQVSAQIGSWNHADAPNTCLERKKLIPARGLRDETPLPTDRSVRRVFLKNMSQPTIAPPEQPRAFVPDLPWPKPAAGAGLSLESGRLDPTFRSSHFRQDLALRKAPDAFKASLPFGNAQARAAFSQNELSSSLSTNWSHGLRGARY